MVVAIKVSTTMRLNNKHDSSRTKTTRVIIRILDGEEDDESNLKPQQIEQTQAEMYAGQGKELEATRRKQRIRLWVCSSLFMLLFVIILIVFYTQQYLQDEGQPIVGLANAVRSACQDEVTRLPSANFRPNFRHYSGYLEADNVSNRFWHYWFLESQSEPSNDPLVLWLNGGPGCSSLMGLLNELGPFKINQDGCLVENPHAWNKRANVIFIESPAGVGFSYAADGSLESDDKTTAEQNYKALKSFYEKFPHFKNRSLYLTGESYASVYLSTLALLLDQDQEINLKGVAIGNGCLEGMHSKISLIFFAYYRGLIGDEIWVEFSKLCCRGREPSYIDCQQYEFNLKSDRDPGECQEFLGDVSVVVLDGGLNLYNLYANCSHPGLQETLRPENFRPNCYNSTLNLNYLNRADVRQALHVPNNFKRQFLICNRDIQYRKIYTDGLTDQFARLLKSSRKLRLFVYSGDSDMICNHLGDDWFVKNLDQTLVERHRSLWLHEQVIGYSKIYKGITFATVKGAGHMVPADKPVESLFLFHEFISPNSSLFSS